MRSRYGALHDPLIVRVDHLFQIGVRQQLRGTYVPTAEIFARTEWRGFNVKLNLTSCPEPVVQHHRTTSLIGMKEQCSGRMVDLINESTGHATCATPA